MWIACSVETALCSVHNLNTSLLAFLKDSEGKGQSVRVRQGNILQKAGDSTRLVRVTKGDTLNCALLFLVKGGRREDTRCVGTF